MWGVGRKAQERTEELDAALKEKNYLIRTGSQAMDLLKCGVGGCNRGVEPAK
jgi:hypothetical protein